MTEHEVPEPDDPADFERMTWESFAEFALAAHPTAWGDALIDWLRGLNAEWSNIDFETIASLKTNSDLAFFVGEKAGFIESRLQVQAISDDLRTVPFEIQVTGKYIPQKHVLPKIQAAWPVANSYQPMGGSARLTADGMKAKLAIESGDHSRKLSVLHDAHREAHPSVFVRLLGGSPLHSPAVAVANATASVGPMTFAPQISISVPPPTAAASSDSVNVDALMAAVMLKDPEAMGWSAQKLADAVGRSKSTVVESATWKNLQRAREAEKERRRG